MSRDEEPSSVLEEPVGVRPRPWWASGMICLTIVPLIAFIGQSSRTLWGEWGGLRSDQTAERSSAVVGYRNINPNPSFAARPANWWHDEGDRTLLWAGWHKGENRWYRFERGDLDDLKLSFPLGRDMIRVIDRPLFEREGGDIWGRVPDDALVANFVVGDRPTAYPLRVLDKVEVVNDRAGDQPILIAYTPVVHDVSLYEASLEGRRITLGHSGFFIKHEPVLYDRSSQSFWMGRPEGMTAVAGPRKGAKLKRIARTSLVVWSSWRADHPDGQLLIGADRSGPAPTE